MAEAKSNITLVYWGGLRSRTHYINFPLAATGNLDKVELQTNLPYPGTPEWAALPQGTKSAWGSLPYLKDAENDVEIGESMGILRYLSKRFGTDPVNPADYALMQQAISWVGGTHELLSGAHYSADRTASMNALLADDGKLDKSLRALESTMTTDNWFGSAPSPGDYAVAAMMDIIHLLEPGFLDRVPKLNALRERVSAIPAVAAYLETVPYPYFKRNSD